MQPLRRLVLAEIPGVDRHPRPSISAWPHPSAPSPGSNAPSAPPRPAPPPHRLAKLRILGEESRTGMDRLGARRLAAAMIFSPRDSSPAPAKGPICTPRPPPAHASHAIRVRKNGNGANAQPPSRPHDPRSNLAPIGDEKGADHRNSSPERGGGPAAGWWRGPRARHASTMPSRTPSKLRNTSPAGMRKIMNPWSSRKPVPPRIAFRRPARSCASPSTSMPAARQGTRNPAKTVPADTACETCARPAAASAPTRAAFRAGSSPCAACARA
jgi:hypothetical protein